MSTATRKTITNPIKVVVDPVSQQTSLGSASRSSLTIEPPFLMTQAASQASRVSESAVTQSKQALALANSGTESVSLNQQQALAMVAAANAAPVVTDEYLTVNAGVPVSGPASILISNDTDPDGDVLTIVRYGQPAHGVLQQSPDGTISYTANANYSGADSFTYTVNDGQGNETVGTVYLTVLGSGNQAPVVQGESVTVQAGVPATGTPALLLANDTDPDGDLLSIARYGQPAHGTLTQNPDGSITYTANANYSGVDSFTYVVTDGQGNESTGTVTLTVTAAPNTAPTAVNDTATVGQDGSVTIAVLGNDTDPEGDSLSVSAVGAASNGVATLNADGRITYVPKAGFTGTDSFSYTVSDGKGGSSTAQVSVTVQASAPDMLASADSGTSNSDNITSNTRPGFTIPSPPVGSVAVLLVDGVEVAATYNATAKTLTPNAAIAEGDHQISYGYKPSAGGALTLTSGALSISIDAIKEAPGLIDLAAASDSGGSATDNITNVTKPVFSVGPLPKAGDVFNLYVNGSKVAATYDAATGTLTPVTALAAATHSITYSLTNAAGVESARSPALSLVIDTTTPTTNLNSFASKLTTATDLGLSNTDGITSNNKPSLSNQALTSTYFSEAGAVGTASLFVDGVKVASVWDKVAGTLTPVNALTDGPHTLSFSRTDSAGNETTVSTQTYRITVDTSTPVAPTLTPDMLATADSGSSNSDNITSNTRPGFVVGDPLPGGRIDLLVDGVVVAATYTAATKTLVPNVALTEGSHTIAIVNVSAAGAQSAASAALTIDIDAIKEAPATAPDLSDGSDSGSSTTDNITNLTRPAFVVGALPKAGDVANLYVDGVKVASTYDAAAGTLTPNLVMTAAAHTVTWSVTNAAGVESARSASLGLTIDTAAPTTPVALDLQAGSDTGTSNTDNITANNMPSFTVGTVAASDSVSLWVDGVEVPSTFDLATRTITAQQALTDGVHQISIKVIDAAGNASLASPALKVDIRTQAPLPLTAPDLLASSDTAGSDSDDLTSVNQPVFKVPTAPTNCTAVLYVDGLKVNASFDAKALTLKPVGALSEGNHLITYAWVDGATGAESQLSPPLPMRIAFNPVVAGSEGNDTLVAAVDTDETVINRNLGGGVTIDTVQTPTFDQAFVALGGNDLVEAGDGGDWVDLGASGNTAHTGTGQAVTTANVAQTVLMSEEDWKMVDSFGNFATGITANSATDAQTVNGWANVANGGWGQDVVKGGAGVDLVYGSFDNDYIDGGAGIDGLRGGNGDDTLVGGAGNDVLRGDDGSDTFYWRGTDKGAVGTPETDQITDFAALNFAEGGDVLDLRDLLSGEAIGPNGTVGNLANYLEFDTTSQPGTTLIHVSSKGQFTNGAYSAAAEDLTISLNGVDLRTALDLNAQATDAQLIEELLKRGNLIAGG